MKKRTNKIRLLSVWALIAITVLMATAPGVSLAENQSQAQASSTDSTNSEKTTSDATRASNSNYPYQQTFIVSAYYSPLANQNKYVTGSFAGDVRLNGEGVHSADGSKVYPGMIAAPSSYAFGTKMKIPGIGVVAVHDRGGAIVKAGQRNQAFDRLDVWMGYGDTGLTRALNWGRRTVNVTVYGIDPSIKEDVYLEGYSEAEKYIQNALQTKPAMFPDDLNFGKQNDEVKSMQSTLKTLGYYSGSINGNFDELTQRGITQFQIDVGIVDSPLDFGAGYFGPQTRKALESTFNNQQAEIKKNVPQNSLGKDDQGEEVKKLQTALKHLGYNVDLNGVYDEKTVEAIFKFQKDNQIIESREDQGAGFFGPQTMQILADKLNDALASLRIENQTVIVSNAFDNDLQLGSKGEDVLKLQQELKKINLLGIAPSGYYGEVTAHAVFKFQQIQGLAASKSSTGAGVFGKLTRTRLNSIVGERERKDKLIADKRKQNLNDEIALAN